MEIIQVSKVHHRYDEKLDFTFWKVFKILLLEGSEGVMLRMDFLEFGSVVFFLFFEVAYGSLSWSLIKLL